MPPGPPQVAISAGTAWGSAKLSQKTPPWKTGRSDGRTRLASWVLPMPPRPVAAAIWPTAAVSPALRAAASALRSASRPTNRALRASGMREPGGKAAGAGTISSGMAARRASARASRSSPTRRRRRLLERVSDRCGLPIEQQSYLMLQVVFEAFQKRVGVGDLGGEALFLPQCCEERVHFPALVQLLLELRIVRVAGVRSEARAAVEQDDGSLGLGRRGKRVLELPFGAGLPGLAVGFHTFGRDRARCPSGSRRGRPRCRSRRAWRGRR